MPRGRSGDDHAWLPLSRKLVGRDIHDETLVDEPHVILGLSVTTAARYLGGCTIANFHEINAQQNACMVAALSWKRTEPSILLPELGRLHSPAESYHFLNQLVSERIYTRHGLSLAKQPTCLQLSPEAATAKALRARGAGGPDLTGR
jgi:hypothetical protein